MSKWTLYGTTSGGGAYGGGTVFKVTTKGVETILHSFCGQANCADGSYPIGGLIADKSGNLYGTTYYGGANTGCTDCNTYRCGTVFEVTPGGSESVIYSFCAQPGCTDGAYPSGGPVIDASGNLYGTTVYGGTNAYAGGTVYVISPGGSETVLHSFYSAEDGYAYYPPDKLLLSKRYLYGATQCGGNSGGGIVFRLSKDGGWRRFAARAVIFEEEPLAAFVLCRSEPR